MLDDHFRILSSPLQLADIEDDETVLPSPIDRQDRDLVGDGAVLVLVNKLSHILGTLLSLFFLNRKDFHLPLEVMNAIP